MKPRHLWYKVSQNATRRSCKPKPNTDLKTNPGNASGEAEHRLSALAPDWRGTRGLFDRHGEPPDQPRDFVQMVGIVRRDGSREPNEALVIAHLGDVWEGRRCWSHREGPDVWHRITSWRTPAPSNVRCECVFLRLGSRCRSGAGSPGSAPDRIFCIVRNGNKSLPHRQFASPIEVACERPISRFARLWGFVIRSPLRPPWGFACSSVAQR